VAFLRYKEMLVLTSVVMVVLLAACATTRTARLYTIDGQILEAHFSYSGTGRGTVSCTLPDGEIFQGEYFTVTNRQITASILSTPWGPITGVSLTEAGGQVSHITAVGDRGTQLICVSFPRGAHGFGGCRDSKGGEYRLHY